MKKREVKNAKKSNLNVLTLIVCLLTVLIVASIGSFFTKDVNSSWYQSIKPSITPPNFVFPIAWSILFFLIGLSLYFAWISKMKKGEIIILFGANFILNIMWSYFYFALHSPLTAFIDVIFLEVSIIALIFALKPHSKLASYLLIPYALWVLFASVLNYLSI